MPGGGPGEMLKFQIDQYIIPDNFLLFPHSIAVQVEPCLTFDNDKQNLEYNINTVLQKSYIIFKFPAQGDID